MDQDVVGRPQILGVCRSSRRSPRPPGSRRSPHRIGRSRPGTPPKRLWLVPTAERLPTAWEISMARSATAWDSPKRDISIKMHACSVRICESSNDGSPEGSEACCCLQCGERRLQVAIRSVAGQPDIAHGLALADRNARRRRRSTVGQPPWPVAPSLRSRPRRRPARATRLDRPRRPTRPSRPRVGPRPASARVRLSCASAKANISASSVAAAAHAGSTSTHTPASHQWEASSASRQPGSLGDQFRMGAESGRHPTVEPGPFARQQCAVHRLSHQIVVESISLGGRRRRPEGACLPLRRWPGPDRRRSGRTLGPGGRVRSSNR